MRHAAPALLVLVSACVLAPPRFNIEPCASDADCGSLVCRAGDCVIPSADGGSLPGDAGVGTDAAARPVDGGPPLDAADAGSPCGDGVRDEGEACDDGDPSAGDGCFACAVEPDWSCVGEVGARSLCAPSVSVCSASDRETVPLSFGTPEDLSAGVIDPGNIGASETRFVDLGGLGLVDVLLRTSDVNLASDVAHFESSAGLSIRFVRTGTEVPLAAVGPVIELLDFEEGDLVGPFTLSSYGRTIAPPYVSPLFTGAAEPSAGDHWEGTAPYSGGFDGDKSAAVQLGEFAVSGLAFAAGAAQPGQRVGFRVEGAEVAICDYQDCGDGVRTEACDDGNRLDGDGCSAGCELEPNAVCRCRAPFALDEQGTDSPILGGDGGGTVGDVDCPEGTVAVGINGAWDDAERVKGLRLRCAELHLDDGFALIRGPISETEFAGLAAAALDTDIADLDCPAGQVLTALHAERKTTTLFANLEIGCRPLDRDAQLGAEDRFFVDETAASADGPAQSAECAAGSVITGLHDTSYGDSLDRVSAFCRAISVDCGAQANVCLVE